MLLDRGGAAEVSFLESVEFHDMSVQLLFERALLFNVNDIIGKKTKDDGQFLHTLYPSILHCIITEKLQLGH